MSFSARTLSLTTRRFAQSTRCLLPRTTALRRAYTATPRVAGIAAWDPSLGQAWTPPQGQHAYRANRQAHRRLRKTTAPQRMAVVPLITWTLPEFWWHVFHGRA
jgi:hypothetical protein